MNMLTKTLRTLLAVGAIALVPISVSFATETQALGTEARIPFANHGGIRDWQADRDQPPGGVGGVSSGMLTLFSGG